jgi:hypothetical protein
MEKHTHHRSFFWPILLVGIGVIWLLRNLGIIQPFSVSALLRLWPILLIVLGVDIIFSHRYAWFGATMGLIVVAGVVAYLISAPTLGIENSPTTQTENFSTPAKGVESVTYDFDTSSSPVQLDVLDENSSDLMQAKIIHRGTMNFDVSGSTNKTVRLSEDFDNSNWFYWDFSFNELKWDVALSPDVPAEINLNGGSGSITMDLNGLVLKSLHTDLGSGSTSITLPESQESYTAEINSGSGSVNLHLPEDTTLTLSLDTGSGSTSVNIPSNAAIRIEVMDDGSGSLSLPDGLEKSEDSSDFSIGSWQTKNYDQAKDKILIEILSQGSGSISIH